VVALFLSLALAADPGAEDPAFAPYGHRITAVGGGPGVSLGEAVVIGGDGSTAVTTVAARLRQGRVFGHVALPFASYATHDGRDTNLGNLHLEGWYRLSSLDGAEHAAGMQASVNPGGEPWTWANRPEEVWPGAGVDALWQVRTTDIEGLTLLGRAGFGLHGTPGYAPFPRFWPRAQAAVGAELPVLERVGLTGEASLAYWDVSPFELSGFVHGDPIEGLRVRGGLVLPMATWLGWNPVGVPGGIREATLTLDLRTAL